MVRFFSFLPNSEAREHGFGIRQKREKLDHFWRLQVRNHGGVRFMCRLNTNIQYLLLPSNNIVDRQTNFMKCIQFVCLSQVHASLPIPPASATIPAAYHTTISTYLRYRRYIRYKSKRSPISSTPHTAQSHSLPSTPFFTPPSYPSILDRAL